MGHKFKIGDRLVRVQAIDDNQWKASTEHIDTNVFTVRELVGTGFVRLEGIRDFWNEYSFDLVDSQ